MSRLSNILPKVIGVLAITTTSTMATQLEITPYIGNMSGSDLTVTNSNASIPVDSATHFGIGLSWQESPNGQGQVLLNYSSHDFKIDADGPTSSLDVLYAHFNGIAQFKQRKYITTVSVGLGVARFSSDGGSEISPSFTAAIGTRYELSNVASIVTELRSYASLMQDGDTLFCKTDTCTAGYEDAAWIDTSISIGFAYKF